MIRRPHFRSLMTRPTIASVWRSGNGSRGDFQSKSAAFLSADSCVLVIRINGLLLVSILELRCVCKYIAASLHLHFFKSTLWFVFFSSWQFQSNWQKSLVATKANTNMCPYNGWMEQDRIAVACRLSIETDENTKFNNISLFTSWFNYTPKESVLFSLKGSCCGGGPQPRRSRNAYPTA